MTFLKKKNDKTVNVNSKILNSCCLNIDMEITGYPLSIKKKLALHFLKSKAVTRIHVLTYNYNKCTFYFIRLTILSKVHTISNEILSIIFVCLGF